MLSILPRVIKRALVMEINGVAVLESQSRLQKIIYSLLDSLKVKWLWHQNCFNLCVSEGVKFFYQNKYQYLNNLVVIHNGLNKSIMDSSEVSIKKSDDQIIVFVGNFTSWQRFDLLLKALEHNLYYLRKKRFLVHLYGAGPCFEELASSIISLDLSDIVILKGILSQSEIPEVLSGACLGLILDDRYINRIPLFSPLKYYEYNAFNLTTLYLNQFGDLNLHNCVPFDVGDFGDVLVSLEDRLSVSGVFEESPRTWDNVVEDIFEIYWGINEKC
jgi:glycosyltransferase involved in cell wall biosynthesis